jgi:hypothetical protein
MDSPKDHDPLSTTLRSWQVHPAADPQFRPSVWQRIGRQRQESWFSYVRAHRLGVTAAAIVMLGAASWTGHSAAQAKAEADRDAMVVTYLVGLDPRVQAKLRP